MIKLCPRQAENAVNWTIKGKELKRQHEVELPFFCIAPPYHCNKHKCPYMHQWMYKEEKTLLISIFSIFQHCFQMAASSELLKPREFGKGLISTNWTF